jgi:hypothetical protein
MTLQYKDEEDRAYGLAGMAISLAALDAIDNVTSVSIDTEGPMVTFSEEFYFSGSPTVSPKVTWNTMLHNLYVASSMVIANLMARSLTRNGKEIPTDVQKEVRQEIAREGKDLCQLEEDEIEQLYRKTQNHMRQIFANRMLRPAIGQFAKKITERRTLSAHDILEELESLHII